MAEQRDHPAHVVGHYLEVGELAHDAPEDEPRERERRVERPAEQPVVHRAGDPVVPRMRLRVDPERDAVVDGALEERADLGRIERSTVDVREDLDPRELEVVDAAVELLEEPCAGPGDGPDPDEPVGVTVDDAAELVVGEAGELEGRLVGLVAPDRRWRHGQDVLVDPELVHVVEASLDVPEERRPPGEPLEAEPALEVLEQVLSQNVGERVDDHRSPPDHVQRARPRVVSLPVAPPGVGMRCRFQSTLTSTSRAFPPRIRAASDSAVNCSTTPTRASSSSGVRGS